MATDNREAIHAALVAVAPNVGEFATIGRNIVDIPIDHLPAFVVYEGDEEVDEMAGATRRHSPAAPKKVLLTIAVRLAARGAPETIGTTINALRTTLIQTVLGDATLAGLCLDGVVQYDGTTVDILSDDGSPIIDMTARFSFPYVLRP